MKSSECPPSANARSVAAASRASASTAGEAPAAIAVSRVRSAASRWRTFVQRRSQRLSAAGSGRLASGARSRRGACAVAVRRHAARAVEQGEIGFLLRQHGQEIAERREDRETHAPAVAVLRTEQRHLPHDVGRRYVGRELTMHGLGDDEAEIVREAVRKPLMPVRGGIGMTERGLHPDLAIAHLDRTDRDVVRPQIEGAAACEIEAGVMPVAGQDAVLDAAALERKAHVRATVVEGEDAPAVVDDEDRTMATVHNEPPLRLQLLKAPRKREFSVRRVHVPLCQLQAS